MEDDRIRHLIMAHLDGRLSDEEFTELQQRLETDTDVGALYAELARLDAELRETSAAEDERGKLLVTGLFRRPIHSLALRIGIAVAAALIVVLIPIWILTSTKCKRMSCAR